MANVAPQSGMYLPMYVCMYICMLVCVCIYIPYINTSICVLVWFLIHGRWAPSEIYCVHVCAYDLCRNCSPTVSQSDPPPHTHKHTQTHTHTQIHTCLYAHKYNQAYVRTCAHAAARSCSWACGYALATYECTNAHRNQLQIGAHMQLLDVALGPVDITPAAEVHVICASCGQPVTRPFKVRSLYECILLVSTPGYMYIWYVYISCEHKSTRSIILRA
jgi:hypothetical protein